MPVNFFATIFQTLLRNKEKELIRWPAEEGSSKNYTGHELLEKIGAIRMALLNQHITPSQPVLLAVPVSIDLICALLAIQAIGAVPVLPPAKAGAGGLLKVIRDRKIRFVVIARSPNLLRRTAAWMKNFKFIMIHGLPEVHQEILVTDVPPAQPALVSHSSGSTGAAKAVYRSHAVLLAQHQVLKETFPPWPDQVDFPLFPNILLHNLAAGTTSVLPDIPRFELSKVDPAVIAGQLIREGIHTLTGNVYYFKKLLAYFEQHALYFLCVQAIGIGGSPVPELLALSLKKIFPRATIFIIYGSSEAEPIAVRMVGDEPVHPLAGYKVGTVSKHIQLALAPAGEVVVAGKRYPVGEITIKGPHVAISTGTEALGTGDFGYLDEHNELCLTARKGNELICKGLQHYQLEQALMQDQRVERAAAIVRKDGFHLYVQGNIGEQEISNILKKWIDISVIKSISKRNRIPVDQRHLSKILYNKVR